MSEGKQDPREVPEAPPAPSVPESEPASAGPVPQPRKETPAERGRRMAAARWGRPGAREAARKGDDDTAAALPSLEGLVPGSPEAVAAAKARLVERKKTVAMRRRERKRRELRAQGDETPVKGGLSPKVESFARRWDADALRDDDKELIERVRELDRLRGKGHTWDETAAILGSFRDIPENGPRLRQFTKEGMYQYISGVLKAQPTRTDDDREIDPARIAQRQIRESRENLAGLLPTAIEYLQDCLRRDEEGKWLAPDRAEWAVQTLVKAANLDDGAERPLPEVSLGVIATVDAEADAYDDLAKGRNDDGHDD